jgi:alkylation response protein AidB-like acyl-CoA dehydrogenase
VSEQEAVESFRARARAFLEDNIPRQTGRKVVVRARASEEEELAEVQRERALQRTLFDGGFAGICFPVEYGGLGLTLEHQRAFNEERSCTGTRARRSPGSDRVPTRRGTRTPP